MSLKVGLIGCGAIGSEIARAIDREIPQMELVALCDRNEEKAKGVFDQLTKKPRLAKFQEVIEKADLVVEAASPKVVEELVKKVIKEGKDILIMSVGGIIDHIDLLREAQSKGCRVYFPSGAIAGIDGIKAAKEAKISSVTLTTSKPPLALEGAPYIVEKEIDLKKINKSTLIFEGSCRQAIKAFPKNINVSATLSLAGVGIDKTMVRIIADPSLDRNIHHILVEGNFGKIEIKVSNIPSPTNPKTSYLAPLSAIATLKKIVSSLQVGT